MFAVNVWVSVKKKLSKNCMTSLSPNLRKRGSLSVKIAHTRVCLLLRTNSTHDTAQNSSDNLPVCPINNHHRSLCLSNRERKRSNYFHCSVLFLLMHWSTDDDDDDVVVGFLLLLGTKISHQLQHCRSARTDRRLPRSRDSGTSSLTITTTTTTTITTTTTTLQL